MSFTICVLVMYTLWTMLAPGLVHIIAPSDRYRTSLTPSDGLEIEQYAVLPLLVCIQTN